ncbi:hypothetical protein PP182_08650 [Maribacter sp. PR1]|uniref:Uncharacterized protein n=2 Tax=Flavobacteriaceae TaxID=49546 RepID=A0ABU7ITI6_9FLAO|nr:MULTISPECIES: hypothetical protein [Maribacter]MDC6388749.1 hypothetical protein [Maribacter sp. PR1]MEE1976138.1 hypothetical protein [Maribacter cobaltidurans]PIB39051.1 hypothetical protein BFP75_00825 [Maribacter sp. 4G9]
MKGLLDLPLKDILIFQRKYPMFVYQGLTTILRWVAVVTVFPTGLKRPTRSIQNVPGTGKNIGETNTRDKWWYPFFDGTAYYNTGLST